MSFSLTPKQLEAMQLLSSDAKYILLYGGSRSGKTFLWVRALVMRAVKAKGSRHAIFRFRNNSVKQSIMMDTFPKVMRLCFPGVPYEENKSDMFVRFQNGSEIWFGGLDDKERVEKILGNEYATMAFNECSQIPYASYVMALTRLAQRCVQSIAEKEADLKLKVYLDANPPSKTHWIYRIFVQKLDPDTREPLKDPGKYGCMQLNPADNAKNLPEDYIETLESMSERMRRRFLYGQFTDDSQNALFPEVDIDKWRKTDSSLPDMVRLVVAVDPSGADDDPESSNDAIGITVCGLGIDGVGYLLEDVTVKAGPATWGKVATDAYRRHQADVIIGEQNFGGDMVRYVVKTSDPKANFKKITASRGKVARAEPIAALVTEGKVRLVGYYPELEEELAGFKKNLYIGEKSPNRADAFIWGMAELFPGVVTPRKEKPRHIPVRSYGSGANSWMGA